MAADFADLLRAFQEFRAENREDHRLIFDKLGEYHTQIEVTKNALEEHKKACQTKHNLINKILYLFASTILLGAGGLILRELIGG